MSEKDKLIEFITKYRLWILGAIFLIWLFPSILILIGWMNVDGFDAQHQALSGLFTGLAFLGAVNAIAQQYEFNRSQEFERYFQSIIATFISCREHISYDNLIGFEALKKCHGDMTLIINNDQITEKEREKCLSSFFKANFYTLGVYFKKLEFLLDVLINKFKNHDGEDCKHYKSLLFFQFSREEIEIIYVYSESSDGALDFLKKIKIINLFPDDYIDSLLHGKI